MNEIKHVTKHLKNDTVDTDILGDIVAVIGNSPYFLATAVGKVINSGRIPFVIHSKYSLQTRPLIIQYMKDFGCYSLVLEDENSFKPRSSEVFRGRWVQQSANTWKFNTYCSTKIDTKDIAIIVLSEGVERNPFPQVISKGVFLSRDFDIKMLFEGKSKRNLKIKFTPNLNFANINNLMLWISLSKDHNVEILDKYQNGVMNNNFDILFANEKYFRDNYNFNEPDGFFNKILYRWKKRRELTYFLGETLKEIIFVNSFFPKNLNNFLKHVEYSKIYGLTELGGPLMYNGKPLFNVDTYYTPFDSRNRETGKLTFIHKEVGKEIHQYEPEDLFEEEGYTFKGRIANANFLGFTPEYLEWKINNLEYVKDCVIYKHHNKTYLFVYPNLDYSEFIDEYELKENLYSEIKKINTKYKNSAIRIDYLRVLNKPMETTPGGKIRQKYLQL